MQMDVAYLPSGGIRRGERGWGPRRLMSIRNLLLVESDDQQAEQIQQLLRSAESMEAHQEVFAIHRSTCLHHSLALLQDREIDVILLDDALPDHSAIESIHQIQASGYSAPIILYTEISDDELTLQAVRAVRKTVWSRTT